MGMIPQGRDGLDLLTIALNERKYIGAKVVGNEEEIVREIARLLEIFECQRVFITTGGELVTMNALLAVPVV
ncbi:hypothetical protein V6N13_032495 [Hibiscus sabdariffa]|uniref:Uncharacterized protein n=1 Tax=Hibiscus sabdariffa TaxID=183260 RepID=A0ABR2C1J3_9ROSI